MLGRCALGDDEAGKKRIDDAPCPGKYVFGDALVMVELLDMLCMVAQSRCPGFGLNEVKPRFGVVQMHVPDGRCGTSDGVVPSLAGDRGSVYFLKCKRKNALLDVCHGIEVTIECHGCFAEFLGYFSYGELVDAFAIGYFEPFG